MPSLTEILKRWWKRMLMVMIVSLVVIGTIVFLRPVQYLSVATAVPASTYTSDRGSVFNENIQALYGTLGAPDDLDAVLGTAALDTVYRAVTDKFNLWDHYKIKGNEQETRLWSARKLRKNVNVSKSGYGELKIKVWDTDRNLAPQLANAVLDQLHEMHQNIRSAANEATLKGLVAGKLKLEQQLDTLKTAAGQTRIDQYDKLVGEYQLMVDSKPPVLIVVEKATASLRPDRPRKKQVLAATALLSLLFSFMAALILERTKSSKL